MKWINDIHVQGLPEDVAFKQIVIENECANFLFVLTAQDKSRIEFSIYEVSAWEMDNTPSECELYLKATIKWDSCSHFWFGGEDKDGYIHICGKHALEKHVKLMNVIWVEAKLYLKELE